MTIMLIHIKKELMCICYSMSPFCRTSKKNFACSGLTFPRQIMEKVFSLMTPCLVFLYGHTRVTTIQRIVTKVMICTPIRKSLDPPLRVPIVMVSLLKDLQLLSNHYTSWIFDDISVTAAISAQTWHISLFCI